MFHSIYGIHHSYAANFRGKVTTTCTDCIFNTFTQTVNNCGKLLDTCTRCTNNTNFTRVNFIGKSDRHTLNNTSATIRPHNYKTFFMSLLFKLFFVLYSNIIAKHKNIHAFIKCTISFKCCISTCNRNNCHISIRHFLKSFIPRFNAFGLLILSILFFEICINFIFDNVHSVFIIYISDNYHIICTSGKQFFCIKTALFKDIFISWCCHHNRYFINPLHC